MTNPMAKAAGFKTTKMTNYDRAVVELYLSRQTSHYFWLMMEASDLIIKLLQAGASDKLIQKAIDRRNRREAKHNLIKSLY